MSGWSFGHKWVCSLGRKAFKFLERISALVRAARSVLTSQSH